jgi:hypothetical protein
VAALIGAALDPSLSRRLADECDLLPKIYKIRPDLFCKLQKRRGRLSGMPATLDLNFRSSQFLKLFIPRSLKQPPHKMLCQRIPTAYLIWNFFAAILCITEQMFPTRHG